MPMIWLGFFFNVPVTQMFFIYFKAEKINRTIKSWTKLRKQKKSFNVPADNAKQLQKNPD
jgi:hypothetical protein